MFESVQMAPPDAILGITEAFKKDPNPHKINLSVGVYKDEKGSTPIFDSVKKAEEKILASEKTKGYLPIDGSPEYAHGVQEMIFGKGHEIIASKRAATSHTPGGTAALRVAGDLIKTLFPNATVWASDPTWPNHPSVFKAASLKTASYPYFDAPNNRLALDAMLNAIEAIPAGDVILLHGCCHNPTGIDPTVEEWKRIGELIAKKGIYTLVDFAYQGLAEGLTEDAAGVLELCRQLPELLIASSFSKNFGLYNERVGALTVVGATEDAAQRAQSQVKTCIRANYSNPPSHGGAIVTTILGDAELYALWEGEVTEMRNRINGMRILFVDSLKKHGVSRDFSFIINQRGMFSFSGLNKDQVERLKKEFGIYIVGSGRINVAGMTKSNMDTLCAAIAKVL